MKNPIFRIGIQYDKVLLVLTDAAAYMIAAMRSLQILFSKMLHLTCFDHGLHRVAEFIRAQFPNVNKLIANTKAVFSKVFEFFFTRFSVKWIFTNAVRIIYKINQ